MYLLKPQEYFWLKFAVKSKAQTCKKKWFTGILGQQQAEEGEEKGEKGKQYSSISHFWEVKFRTSQKE